MLVDSDTVETEAGGGGQAVRAGDCRHQLLGGVLDEPGGYGAVDAGDQFHASSQMRAGLPCEPGRPKRVPLLLRRGAATVTEKIARRRLRT